MLSFNLRVGDDVYLGKEGAPLSTFDQIVLNRANGEYLTLLTPREEIDIPYDGSTVELGLHDAKVRVRADAADQAMFTLGIDAPLSVRILRGRVYRREMV